MTVAARLTRLEARAPRTRLVSPESRERLRKIMSGPEAGPLFLEVANDLQCGGRREDEPEMAAKIALLNRRLREIGVEL